MSGGITWTPARSYKALEHWALDWKSRIGELYHRNHLRLEHWDRERPLDQQSEIFDQHHQAVHETLQGDARRSHPAQRGR